MIEPVDDVTTIEIDDSDITAKLERFKFKINTDVAEEQGYWSNILDPHLQVWF